MKPILEIKNISKKFRLTHNKQAYLSLRDSLASIFTRNTSKYEDFYALNDVSFNVNPGDSIGIIGKNGAGKSTLLKILSKITPPTSGSIIARGRIASLLEVGTGFHPELTGRENVFLNGSILGMKRREIVAKFDEIVDFSGTERFLDTPLKHFSSGMQLRLAFAVAAFLDPEILVIDEVLGVGDAEFQKKCMHKMESVTKEEGRTVLFVSHNLSQIQSLCTTGILLSDGKIRYTGETSQTVKQYLEKEVFLQNEKTWTDENAPGDDNVILCSTRIINGTNELERKFSPDESIGIEIKYKVLNENACPYPNIHLFKMSGECILVNVHPSAESLKGNGYHSVTVKIPPDLLNDGAYYVGIAATTFSPWKIHFYEQQCLFFEVIEDTKERKHPYNGTLPGFIRGNLKWTN